MPATKKAAARLSPPGRPPQGAPAAGTPEDDFGVGYYNRLFTSLSIDAEGRIPASALVSRLRESGISETDPRMAEVWSALRGDADTEGRSGIDLDRFIGLCKVGGNVLTKAVRGDFVIPDFGPFQKEISRIYEDLKQVEEGHVADYIPQLSRVSPEKFGVALCTVDGQRFAAGDADTAFCIQSISKTINYCLALEEHGTELVHRHVGREPSGRGFNELTLNGEGLPHNPMINSGAIMCCSLLHSDWDLADRFDHVAGTWHRLSGGGTVGFNNAVYLSERRTADRNFALGYFMREKRSFPLGTDLMETLDFYFQCCSIELDTRSLSVVAATLAHYGVNPLTGERILSADTVRKCLSLMSSCGMYDYSGEFAFTIGLPAKSGVSGGLMIVVPGVMGVCVWSPRLDALGNPVRGVGFCKELVTRYNFHVYDTFTPGEGSGKRDPRRGRNEERIASTTRLLWAASQGDLDEVRAVLATGKDPGSVDYDKRTALHLAASEGHADTVRFLLDHGADPEARDRWGGTPLSDAERGGHDSVVALLTPSPAAVR
ncbi:glutaminase A [Streptomyces sp. TS71-3]|uniref:glutaminase A n=1 Tax=Streptomyces sp. TS71-3 TaxID=2733862 RepID=UPI001B2DB543|nr:glutaminase A [Streptomyces sp. TS71-3]GHJ37693.1 glutaminase [Streptomyces sp. TS71-3]